MKNVLSLIATFFFSVLVFWSIGSSNIADHGSALHGEEGIVMKIVPTGTVVPFAGGAVPQGWLECNGAVLDTSMYPALAKTLKGTAFHSAESLRLPDLRNRVPVGAFPDRDGRRIGDHGGAETHTLKVEEMPKHGHDQVVTANPGEHGNVGEAIRIDWNHDIPGLAKDDAREKQFGLPYPQGAITGVSGNGVAHNNMQPYLVLRYIIKI